MRILLATLLSSLYLASAESRGQSSPVVPVDEVTVTGEQPGPALWKVTKDGRVLWILGVLGPLPKNITWRSKQLEEVLRDTQEVIPSGWEVKPIFSVPLLFKFLRGRKLPNKATLDEVLPEDLHERFTTLRDKHAPGDRDLERLRPLEAVRALNSKAIDAVGLSSGNVIQQEVRRLSKKYDVVYREVRLKVKADEMRDVLDEQNELSPDQEIACVKVNLDWLEKSPGELKSQANAWAKGDIDTLRGLFKAQRQRTDLRAAGDCGSGLRGRATLREVNSRGNAIWLATIEDALEKTARHWRWYRSRNSSIRADCSRGSAPPDMKSKNLETWNTDHETIRNRSHARGLRFLAGANVQRPKGRLGRSFAQTGAARPTRRRDGHLRKRRRNRRSPARDS